MTDPQDIVCRGSIFLGTACMKCSKCKAEMDAAIVPSVTPEQNMQAIRAKFTANAEEFDSLLMQVLEENKRLHAELLEIHTIAQCVAEGPDVQEGDSLTVKAVKGMVQRIRLLEEYKSRLLYTEAYLEEAIDAKAHGFLLDPLPLLNDIRKTFGKQSLEEK